MGRSGSNRQVLQYDVEAGSSKGMRAGGARAAKGAGWGMRTCFCAWGATVCATVLCRGSRTLRHNTSLERGVSSMAGTSGPVGVTRADNCLSRTVAGLGCGMHRRWH